MSDNSNVNELIKANDNSGDVEKMMWKLLEFTEELNKRFLEKYGEELGIRMNTLNNHFRKLESESIHFVNRINGVKVYDQLDMDIAEFICVKRSRKLQKEHIWNLPQIYEQIGREFECRLKPQVIYNKNNVGDASKIQEQLEVKMEEIINEKLNEKLNEMNKQQIALQETTVKKDLELAMLDFLELQSQLKKEAVLLWEQKPASERFTGIIFKTERFIERERFIENYIAVNMKKHIKPSNEN